MHFTDKMELDSYNYLAMFFDSHMNIVGSTYTQRNTERKTWDMRIVEWVHNYAQLGCGGDVERIYVTKYPIEKFKDVLYKEDIEIRTTLPAYQAFSKTNKKE